MMPPALMNGPARDISKHRYSDVQTFRRSDVGFTQQAVIQIVDFEWWLRLPKRSSNVLSATTVFRRKAYQDEVRKCWDAGSEIYSNQCQELTEIRARISFLS
jgi:hypothetical protein